MHKSIFSGSCFNGCILYALAMYLAFSLKEILIPSMKNNFYCQMDFVLNLVLLMVKVFL